MNNFKALMRRNFVQLNRLATTSMCTHQLHDIRAMICDPYFTQRSKDTVPNRRGLTKMENKYMYIAKPNVECNLGRKKMYTLGVRHSLNEDYKSNKARARWSEFRRKMIYGTFAL